ncbi:MAG: hypothetical protein AAGI37_19475, partial [Planctomycetota bacterium]
KGAKMKTYEITFMASSGFRDFVRVKADSIDLALNGFRTKLGYGGCTVYSVEIVNAKLPEWSEAHGGGFDKRSA